MLLQNTAVALDLYPEFSTVTPPEYAESCSTNFAIESLLESWNGTWTVTETPGLIVSSESVAPCVRYNSAPVVADSCLPAGS